MTGMRLPQCLCTGAFPAKGISTLQFMLVHFVLLTAYRCGILQLGHKQLVVDVIHGLLHQLCAVERNRVGIFVVDFFPKSLKFLFGKVLVQRVLFHLGLVAVGEHIRQNLFVIHRLNQLMDALCHGSQFFRQRRNCPHLDIRAVFVRNFPLHIHILIADEVELNHVRLRPIDQRGHAIHPDIFALEVFAGCGSGAVIQLFLDIRLQVSHKVFVAFAGDYREHINVMYPVTAALGVHTVATLIHAQTQATAHFLTFSGLACSVFQSANLEDIRVVPAFPQGRMGEDKPGGFLEGKQAFLVFENQVISGDILGKFAAALNLAVYSAPGLFVDAEIALVNVSRLPAKVAKILLIRGIFQRQIFVQDMEILLLKHLTVFTQLFVAVLVVLTVFGHLIDEEQRKGFDSHVEVFLFLFKMGENGFPNLDTAHIGFGHIAPNLAGVKHFTIGKGYGTAQRVYLGDCVAPVLLHLLRNVVQVIVHTQNAGFPFEGFVVANLHFDAGHGGLFRGEDNLLQKQIAVGTAQVLHLEALDLDFLDQALVEGIQRIQHIHQIVLDSMSGRIVQSKQRVKMFQSILCDCTTHFLRLIQNQDGAVGLDNVDGAAGGKFIPLGINDELLFVLLFSFLCRKGPGKSVRVDNHDLNPRTGGEVIQLIQVLAVVNEDAGFFAVILHEVVSHGVETLFDAFPDRNGRYHYDKLTPAIDLVQLEHGLDVHIGFAGTGFHFYVQAAPAETFHQFRGQLDVVFALQFVDVLQKLRIAQGQLFVFKAGVIVFDIIH